MQVREENRSAATKFITSPFWLEEYKPLFADGFHFDFPSAPPGMPQSFRDGEVDNFMEWMGRTVKSWSVELEEIHGVQNDAVTFWAVGRVDADVCWGLHDGHFHSKLIARIEAVDRKIRYMKLMMDPLKFLDAAGRTYPIFRMDIHHPEIDAMLAQHAGNPHSKAEDADSAAQPTLSARIQGNVDAFRSPDYWSAVSHDATYSPNLKAFVWFLPPEMDKTPSYSPEELERVDAWSVLSCPSIDFDSSGVSWKADDADIYFGEYYCKGITRWLGNDIEGHYRNHYFYILRMNEQGEIAVSEEFLNPINKLNSINASVPSFPYYL